MTRTPPSAAPDAIELPALPLPEGIRSRFVDGVNGLRMHVLEAGFETGVDLKRRIAFA